jgi:hypothetical protein
MVYKDINIIRDLGIKYNFCSRQADTCIFQLA